MDRFIISLIFLSVLLAILLPFLALAGWSYGLSSSAIIEISATLTLSGATFGLLFYTKKLVNVETKPQIVPEIHVSSSPNSNARIIFINKGRGGAFNINATWGFEDILHEDKPFGNEWSGTLESSEETQPIDMFEDLQAEIGKLYLKENIQKLISTKESDGILEFSIECSDLLGKNHQFNPKLNVRRKLSES